MYFRGEYWFLSNFYSYRLRDMDYPSITYRSVEAAFQAAKVMTYEERKAFSELSPQEAKRMGRRTPLRPDWESVKGKGHGDLFEAEIQRSHTSKTPQSH